MEFILFVLYFILASFLAFYVPGKVILGNPKKLSQLGTFIASYILGIALWGWQAYLFGFLEFRNLSYLYLFVFILLFLWKKYYAFKIPKMHFSSFDWITILMFVVGGIGQVFPFMRNGQATVHGVFLSFNNASDHIWHASLVNELVLRFPPNEPSLSLVPLLNYHFWFHLVTADLIRVFHLPLWQTQFVGMYSLGVILFAFIVYLLATAIYDSKIFLRLVIFFLFFAGDATAWLTLLLNKGFNLHTSWLFEDGARFMDAPGRAYAIVIAFAAFYLIFKYKEEIPRRLILVSGILFGSLLMFKIYIGIPFLFGLFCLSVFNVFKKSYSLFIVFIIACILSLIQFLPLNASSGGLFLLPFEIPRQFIAQSHLNLSFIDQRWGIYFEHHNYLRLAQYGVIMTIVYLLAQFGIKLFGLVPLRKTIQILGINFYLFLISIVLISFTLSLFFFQKVGGANIWEFLMAASSVLAITVSLNIALYLPKSKYIVYLIIFVIIAFTIPRWADSMIGYFRNDYLSGFHGVPIHELETYDYINKHTSKNANIIFIKNSDSLDVSSYVSIFAKRNTFMSAVGISQITTPEIKMRMEHIKIVKTSLNPKIVEDILRRDKINYIQANIPFILPVASRSSNLRPVFSNALGVLYKVDYN